MLQRILNSVFGKVCLFLGLVGSALAYASDVHGWIGFAAGLMFAAIISTFIWIW
jgi:hypothetical protein